MEWDGSTLVENSGAVAVVGAARRKMQDVGCFKVDNRCVGQNKKVRRSNGMMKEEREGSPLLSLPRPPSPPRPLFLRIVRVLLAAVAAQQYSSEQR